MKLLFFAVSFQSLLYVTAQDFPKAPALANSNWPIAHGSTWNSDYSGLEGTSTDVADVDLITAGGDSRKTVADLLASADAITLVQSNVTGISWGSSVSSVFQIKSSLENGVEIINTLYRNLNFEYHGAYSLLSYDGTYYAATKSGIQAYNNKVPFDFSTEIVLLSEFVVNGLEDNDHIVGLTITHDAVEDAFMIFATSKGKVGGVSLDFSISTDLVSIPGVDEVSEPDHFVSNSIALDGVNGGIYVVTSLSINRLQWDVSTKSIKLDWSTKYSDGKDDWFWGRLGPGSGTSPTIVGVNQVPKYVTICDGQTPMHILFYHTDTGKLAGKSEVLFDRIKRSNTTTDQSLVVKGNRVVASNNWVADQVTPLCSEWFASLNVTDALKHECPFIFGAYAYGLQQFSIDPNTDKVKTEWINSKVSCTSSIPVVTTDDVLFCLGKRSPSRESKIPKYTIEAIDFLTGKELYHIYLSHSLVVNSLYAQTGIGFNNDVVMGTLGGILRVSNVPSGRQAVNKLEAIQISDSIKYLDEKSVVH